MGPSRILGTAIFCLVVGCSGTAKISRSATQINQLAQSSKEKFEEISLDPDHSEMSDAGASEQAEILSLVNEIHRSVPNVQDKVPEWLRTVGFLLLAVISVAGIILLWQTGVGTLMRLLVGRFAVLIPKKKRTEAKFLQEAMNGGEESKIKEAVAVKRATDPAFDAAWKAQKAERLSGD